MLRQQRLIDLVPVVGRDRHGVVCASLRINASIPGPSDGSIGRSVKSAIARRVYAHPIRIAGLAGDGVCARSIIGQTMYTIKQASALTGIGAPRIRAWERRYGVVSPVRTPGGYRLYDDQALRILTTMRSMLGSGWTASEAARAIASGEADLVDLPPPGATPVDERPVTPTHRAEVIERFVAAAASTSAADTEAVLDEILAGGSFEAVVDELLLPATAALGDAWASGRLSVAAEHAASAAVGRRLAAAFQAAGRPGSVSVVVGLPEGSHHELGAMAFATALRRRGVGVLYLGPDVPIDGWLDVIARTRARTAVVGVITRADRAPAAALIAALAASRLAIVATGGAAAGDGLGEDLEPGRHVALPMPVVEAAAIMAQAVGRRR